MEIISKNIYKCGTCGCESYNKSHIEECEKKHICKHTLGKLYKFNLHEVDERIDDMADCLEVVCKECGATLDSIWLFDINKNESVMESLYNSIKPEEI